MEPQEKPDPRPRHIRPRFSMGILLVVMFVFALMAAPGYYLVQGLSKSQMKTAFIILTLSAPALLMAAVGLVYRLIRWWSRTRR